MKAGAYQCRVKERRAARGLSQAQLASQVNVSRQAIVAIEAGRQIPSTLLALQLAQVLSSRVEDLFVAPAPERLVARRAQSVVRPDASRVHLGWVDTGWVAHPVEQGHLPGDGLLAPPSAVLEAHSDSVLCEPLLPMHELQDSVLVAGCAPLLGLLSGRVNQEGRPRSTWLRANSTRALQLLERDLVHVAGVHLVQSAEPGGHEHLVRQHFGRRAMSIFNLTRWRQGLVVAAGNPLDIRSVTDVHERKARLARRDAGAAAARLFEEAWKKELGSLPCDLPGPTAADHDEVARLIQMGLADVGIAIEAVALAYGLSFIPLVEERFDLLVPEERLAQSPVARFFDTLDRASFRLDAGGIPGYDLSLSGQVTTVRPPADQQA